MSRITFSDLARPRRASKRLKAHLSAKGRPLSLTECQDVVAKMAGYDRWSELKLGSQGDGRELACSPDVAAAKLAGILGISHASALEAVVASGLLVPGSDRRVRDRNISEALATILEDGVSKGAERVAFLDVGQDYHFEIRKRDGRLGSVTPFDVEMDMRSVALEVMDLADLDPDRLDGEQEGDFVVPLHGGATRIRVVACDASAASTGMAAGRSIRRIVLGLKPPPSPSAVFLPSDPMVEDLRRAGSRPSLHLLVLPYGYEDSWHEAAKVAHKEAFAGVNVVDVGFLSGTGTFHSARRLVAVGKGVVAFTKAENVWQTGARLSLMIPHGSFDGLGSVTFFEEAPDPITAGRLIFVPRVYRFDTDKEAWRTFVPLNKDGPALTRMVAHDPYGGRRLERL